MKYRLFACFVSAAALLLSFSINARTDGDDRDRDQCRDVDHNEKGPLEALGVITIPGSALASTDIAWVDPGTERSAQETYLDGPYRFVLGDTTSFRPVFGA